jgi:hypothetical protein
MTQEAVYTIGSTFQSPEVGMMNSASSTFVSNHENLSTINATTTSATTSILYTAFRQKTIDMKQWVPPPDSMPSVGVFLRNS